MSLSSSALCVLVCLLLVCLSALCQGQMDAYDPADSEYSLYAASPQSSSMYDLYAVEDADDDAESDADAESAYFLLYGGKPALTRAPVYKTRPTTYKRVAVPYLVSTTQQQKAPRITQKALTETRPTIMQTVTAHKKMEVRPTITKAATIPEVRAEETVTRAKPITQKPLTETRPTITQEAPAYGKKEH